MEWQREIGRNSSTMKALKSRRATSEKYRQRRREGGDSERKKTENEKRHKE